MTNEEFKKWREARFETVHACARAFGVDDDVIAALERGTTRKGSAYPVSQLWHLAIMGYDASNNRRGRRISFDLDEASRLILAGHSLNETAHIIGVCEKTIAHHVRKGRLPPSAHATPESKIDDDRAREMILAGATMTDLRTEFGCSAWPIHTRIVMGRLPPLINSRGQSPRRK